MRRQRDPSLLSTGQAALLLGVSMDTIARMLDAGELPAERTPGGHRRVAKRAVDALITGEA